MKTHEFKEYNVPLPTIPENSVLYWNHLPGEPLQPWDDHEKFYDIKVDSKQKVWVSSFVFGELIRIDPVTGETKAFHAPNTPGIRGIDIDAQDNIWFAGYYGNSLGKLDPKTEGFKLYQAPTRYATPYGIVADKTTGNIWFADAQGNHITRFDPKTEQFTEFPIPSNNAVPRFIGLDNKGRVWFTESFIGKIGVLDPGEGGK